VRDGTIWFMVFFFVELPEIHFRVLPVVCCHLLVTVLYACYDSVIYWPSLISYTRLKVEQSVYFVPRPHMQEQ